MSEFYWWIQRLKNHNNIGIFLNIAQLVENSNNKVSVSKNNTKN